MIQLDSHMEDVDKGLAIYRKECYSRLYMCASAVWHWVLAVQGIPTE